ncbi:MAG: Glycosyl transferase group 1 [uncultured bacterium]|nr:MAG: Glycosyl transferase group 1 [uncultured bacterium]
MHIALLTPEYPLNSNEVGGLGTYTRKTAQELFKRGNKVSIFWESTVNRVSNDNGVNVYEIKCPPLYYGLNSKSILKQFIRVAYVLYSAFKVKYKVFQIHKRYKLDIIQSPNYLAPGYFLKKNSKIPVVSRVSSYAPLYHSAYGLSRTFGDYLIDYLELQQVTTAKFSFSPSYFMQNVYLRYENCNLDFIPTPVEINKHTKSNIAVSKKILSKISSNQYLLYFGSLSRIKGVDLMADVINIIAPKYPSLNFIFAGKDYGLHNNEPVTEFISRSCSLYRKRILFLPYQKHNTLYPLIKNSIGVVSPSRVDNYPNTCLEAQSLGIPVIGTSDSSIDEIIINNKTGFIARNSSSIDIAKKIEKLLKLNKKERLEMKKNIGKNMLAIQKEDRINLLIKYYEKVIAKSSVY